MDEQKRKDQGLWFVTESQRIQLNVGPLGRQVGCFVFYPLFGIRVGSDLVASVEPVDV